MGCQKKAGKVLPAPCRPQSKRGVDSMAINTPTDKSNAPRLERITFRTSREMDFFTERELITQTGHARAEWPLVIVKELIDNALDACEEAGVPPVISVTADPCGITVCDNGPGLPEATLRGALDFTVRVSNREAYVSPCRGAQGNALKTLLPMPYVLDPEQGKFILAAHGKRHEITCGMDPISQRPVINDDITPAKSKNLHDGHGEKKQLFPVRKSAWNGGRQKTKVTRGHLAVYASIAPSANFPARCSRSSRGSPSSTRMRGSRWIGSAKRPSGRQPTRTGRNGSRASRPRPTGMSNGTLSG
jgi:hypothetical protein